MAGTHPNPGLTAAEAAAAEAVAAAILPAGARIPAGGPTTVNRAADAMVTL